MSGLEGFFYKEEKPGRRTKSARKSRRASGRGPSVGKFDCEACGLYKEVNSPKIEPYGKNRKKALVQGEGPGSEEDRRGIPFRGVVGKDFRPYFPRYGLDMERDCITINTVDCRPTDEGGNNRAPTKTEIKCCHASKVEAYEKYNPSVIFLLGEPAIESFYGCDPYRRAGVSTEKGMLGLAAFRGKVIPDKQLKAWVCHSYHPSFITRGNKDLEHIFDLDFAVFASMVGKPRPDFTLYEDEVQILSEYEEVIRLLDDVWTDPFCFDYESTSYRYYEGIHKIVLIGVALSSKKAFVFPYDFTKLNGQPWWNPKQLRHICALWRKILKSNCPKTAHDIKHEELASRAVFGTGVKNWDWDTMLAAHVLDESRKTKGLKVQTYINWGFHYGSGTAPFLKAKPKKRNRIEELDIKETGLRCGRDCIFPNRLAKKQKRVIKAEGLGNAYRLLHDGVLALAEVEQEGIRINVDLARKWNVEWGEEIEELKDRIMSSREAKKFEKRMGRKMNYKKKLSGKDMQVLLFDILELEPARETKTGYAVDEETLLAYADDYEFLANELKVRKLDKRKNTYLAQFLRNEVDGFIYPSINLHIPRSYRSSYREPNFQNIIKHDKGGAVIRKLVIPREGNEIYTVDYSSMEVRIIACVTKDEALIDYITSGGDLHGDAALREFGIFGITKEHEQFEDLRQISKNLSVFPWWYGSYYKRIAKDIWDDQVIRRLGILDEFYPNLTARRRYEKWEGHIRDVENWFWKKFKGGRKWQDEYIEEYKKKGYAQDLSWGFKRRGYLTRNKLYNFPIQGPSFHCLLWSIIRVVEWIRDLMSKLCAEGHDDMLFDMVPREAKKVMRRVDDIMTVKVREANPWIIVPLETEWKRGKNWLEMKGV